MLVPNKKCRLSKNVLGRWILVHPELDDAGWSGSRWVEIDARGLGRAVQVANYETFQEASHAAFEYGLYPFTVDEDDWEGVKNTPERT